MLFILFGGEFRIAHECRRILRDRGFDVIKKYNYVKKEAPTLQDKYIAPAGIYKEWFEDKVYVDQSAIMQCDYKYDLGDITVGFQQTQIMDAIHGKKDAVLTAGSSSLEFVSQMKRAFGDYVTLIYLYIDDVTFRTLLAKHPNITKEETDFRLRSHNSFKCTYLHENMLFDEIVLYSGEDSEFHLKSLAVQLENIEARRKKIERALNNMRYVELPYVGGEPYIFISYSHEDKETVYPVLAMLQRHGFRVWYDEGIEGGENWRQIIQDKIRSAHCFVLFSSRNSAASVAVIKELTTAQVLNIPVISVSLDEAPFNDIDEAVLSGKQKVDIHHEDFEKKIIRALPERCSAFA